MNKIKKAAKSILKYTKGNINFASIEEWLLSQGYIIIFYNTVVGDAEIKRYKLEKKAERTKAFTYSSTAKIVFIDNNVPAEDKKALLYHESGHVALGHMEIERISAENKIMLDIEADAVAYELMNHKSNSGTIIIMLLTALLSFGIGIAIPKINIEQSSTAVINTVTTSEHIRSSMPVVPDETTTEPQALTDESVTDIVYVTPSGERYHRPDCRYVKGKNCAELTKAQAEKNHTPCKVCNP